MIENEVEEDAHVSRVDEHKLINYLAVSLSFKPAALDLYEQLLHP